MTNRNFKKELYYSYYEDMEDGRTTETIDYAALIGIIFGVLFLYSSEYHHDKAECFEQIVMWRTLNAQQYREATEND